MLRQRQPEARPFTGARTSDNRVDPTPATQDKNEMRRLFTREPDAEIGMRRGGKVKATGPVKVHQGEFVVRKAAAQKQGARKMAAVNAGTARITVPKGKRK